MPFFARSERPAETNQWTATQGKSRIPQPSSSQNSTYPQRPRARLSRPPVLPLSIAPSRSQASSSLPPPSYDQVRLQDRRERGGLRVDTRRTAVRSPTILPSVESRLQPLTTNNLAQLDNVRYGEVARQAHLKSRISTVSQYPVFVTATSPSVASFDHRRASRRRPISVASTSTTGIYLAVGQLPGSEPFDLEPPSQDLLDRHEGVAGVVLPRTNNDHHINEHQAPAHTAQAIRVLARNTPNGSTTEVNRFNRVSIISATSSILDISTPRRHPSISSLGSTYRFTRNEPRRPSIQPSSSWPVIASATSQRTGESFRISLDADDGPKPPPPPPKDPGYVVRSPRFRLRSYSSSPNLSRLAAPSAMQREGILKEHSGVGDEKPPRSWFASFGMNRSQQGRNRSPISEKVSKSNLRSEKSTSNRRSALLVACARLIGRAMPRIAVHKESC